MGHLASLAVAMPNRSLAFVEHAIPAAIRGRPHLAKLVTVSVSRATFVLASPEPLKPGWVALVDLTLPSGPWRVLATVRNTRTIHGSMHLVELQPFSMDSTLRARWYAFVDGLLLPPRSVAS